LLVFSPSRRFFLFLIIRLALVTTRALTLYDLLQRSVHQNRDRLSGLLIDPVELPNPPAVGARLVQSLFIKASDSFRRHVAEVLAQYRLPRLASQRLPQGRFSREALSPHTTAIYPA
jgi:hypothetical protein